MFCLFAVFHPELRRDTHFLEVWNIWHAAYWLAGGVKALTAAASILTAILLVKLVSRALALPGPEALQKARDELEIQVQERTAELPASDQKHASRDHRAQADGVDTGGLGGPVFAGCLRRRETAF